MSSATRLDAPGHSVYERAFRHQWSVTIAVVMGAGAEDGRTRVGWMLRVNRLYGPDDAWTRISAFARAFKGGSYRRTASPSAISRWETADLPVTEGIVRRYEELLEQPADLLAATAHTVLRYSASSVLRHPPLAEPVARGELQEVLDMAIGDGIMTGRQWCALAGGLDAAGESAIMPGLVWRHLADRLISEMTIADDVAWMLRFEALNRLLNHPYGGRETVAACTEFAADGRNEAVLEVISALDNTDRADASIRVADQIRVPSSDRTRLGALMAGIRKARYGHFGAEQVGLLLHSFDELLRDPGTSEPERELAVQIVRELPPVEALVARRVVRRILLDDPAAALSRPADGLSGKLAGTLTSRVIARQTRHLPGEHERTFAALVAETISDPSPDVRLFSACLLHATPYGPLLADAISAELGRIAILRDPRSAIPLLDALRFLGSERHRPLLERLILAQGLPPPTAAAASRHRTRGDAQ